MSVLSIQSHVSYGYVGNSAAVFLLQSLGHPVWPVHTVLFSNHPGYENFRGRVVATEELTDILSGLALNGWYKQTQALLAGYMGSATNAQAAFAAGAQIKKDRPDAIVLCDPVMGDHPEGVYVPQDLVGFYRENLCTAADVICPNLFELALLTGREPATISEICEAARELISQGPSLVLVTSVADPAHRDRLGVVAVTADQAWQVFAPRLHHGVKGAGDAFAALWLGHHLNGASVDQALSLAVSGVHHLLSASHTNGITEMPLVTEIKTALDPEILFPVEAVT